MTCTEDQFRSILRAEAAEITADSVPPLPLPADHLTGQSGSRPGAASRPWRRWLVPVGAAAAVVAIAVAATVLATGSRAPAPRPAAGLWHGVPQYYFALKYGPGPAALRPGAHRARSDGSTATLTVRDSRTGVTLATARPSARCEWGYLSAAADDKTAAFMCVDHQGKPQLFMMRFDPAGRRLSIAAVRLPKLGFPDDIALSPDGTRLAVLSAIVPVRLASGSLQGHASVSVRVYSVRTGAVRTWTSPGHDSVGQSRVTWAPGGRVAFGYAATSGTQGTGIRLLNTSAPAGSLLRASKLAVSLRLPSYQSVGPLAISGDGSTLWTTFTGHRTYPFYAEFAEYSLTTGKLLGTSLATRQASEQVFWSDYTGKTLVVGGPAPQSTSPSPVLEILRDGHLTPLPRAQSADQEATLSEIAF